MKTKTGVNKGRLLPLYWHAFSNNFVLIYPVYILLFADRGLDELQISLLFIIWSATALVSSLPAGLVCDRFSRRNLTIAAAVLKAIAFSLWFQFPDFTGFALGFILWGISESIVAAALPALLFTELKRVKEQDQYEKISGQLKSVVQLSTAAALALGGWLATIGYDLDLGLSILVSMMAGLVLLALPPAEKTPSPHSENVDIRQASKLVTKNQALLLLLCIIALVSGTYGAFDEFAGLVLRQYELSLTAIGLFTSATYLAWGLAGLATTLFSRPQIEYLLIILSGLLLFSLPFFTNQISLGLIILATFFLGIAEIKLETLLQNQISSRWRSTIFALKHMLLNLVAIAVTFAFGLTAKVYGIIAVLYVTGGIIILAGIMSQIPNTKRVS